MAASVTAKMGKPIGPEKPRLACSRFFGAEGKWEYKACQPPDEHTPNGYKAINFRIYLSVDF